MVNQVTNFINKNIQGISLGGLAGLILIFLARITVPGAQATLILLGIILGIILQNLSNTQNLSFLKNRLLFIIAVGALIFIAVNIFIPGTIFGLGGWMVGLTGSLLTGGVGSILSKSLFIPIILIGIGAAITVATGGPGGILGIPMIIIGLILLGAEAIAIGSIIWTVLTNFKLILILAGIVIALWIIMKGRRSR